MKLIKECAPAPEPRGVPQRRSSLSKGASMLLKRASSLTRLLPHRHSSKVLTGADESETDHSETCEQEEGLEILHQSVKENIIKLRKYEADIKKQIDSNLSLALARYTSGGSAMGAILPMRKAYKNKTMLKRTTRARKELDNLREEIEEAIVQLCFFNISIKGHTNQMKQILNGLKQPLSSNMPSDEDLLQELKQKDWLDGVHIE
mmetsp:Transcript_20508/g.38905  ORF Transcript_20508/g.38905 Transcript_20508/m.38905 type:complete len:205 (+) Transcript_20508:60-674(+)|eukprot:scaffold3901_cov174-Amphora_coffeaeformis.AAC.2